MGQAEPRPLTDDELTAIFQDDRADLSLLTDEEQARLLKLTDQQPPSTPPPAAAMAGMVGPSTMQGDPGRSAMAGGGGRGTGLDVRKSDEFGLGVVSAMPFSGVSAPETARGTTGRIVGTGALLAFPATKVVGAARGAEGLIGGAKELVNQTAPAVKYEMAKAALTAMGLPPSLAIPAAIAASGYRPGKRTSGAAATTKAETTAATVSPRASTPVVPEPPASSGSAAPLRAGPAWSPQQIRNEVGLAERRAGLTLTEEQRAVADQLVKQGHPPGDVVKALAGQLQGEAAAGALAAKFGLPSTEAVQGAVAARNATGRWPAPSPKP